MANVMQAMDIPVSNACSRKKSFEGVQEAAKKSDGYQEDEREAEGEKRRTNVWLRDRS